jgi:hypothetical protein
LIATYDFSLIERIDGMRPLTIAVPAVYLAVALRFWFYGPVIITTARQAAAVRGHGPGEHDADRPDGPRRSSDAGRRHRHEPNPQLRGRAAQRQSQRAAQGGYGRLGARRTVT